MRDAAAAVQSRILADRTACDRRGTIERLERRSTIRAAMSSNEGVRSRFDRFFAKAQWRGAMHERIDEVFGARPRTIARCGVDMARVAEIDERAAETLCEF